MKVKRWKWKLKDDSENWKKLCDEWGGREYGCWQVGSCLEFLESCWWSENDVTSCMHYNDTLVYGNGSEALSIRNSNIRRQLCLYISILSWAQ